MTQGRQRRCQMLCIVLRGSVSGHVDPCKTDIVKRVHQAALRHLACHRQRKTPLSNARFTLADPMPRLCPDAVGSANVNGLPTRNRPSGPHREAIGRSSGNIKHV